jgi:hypothetical protein
MKRTVSAAIVGIMLTACGVVAAQAQDLKTMLLKPTNGWVIEWFNPGSLDKGTTDVVFEERGGRVVAKLNITNEGVYKAANPICERDVAITADTIRFNGCRDADAVLIRDPNDKVYPLKTTSQTAMGYQWKLKEK